MSDTSYGDDETRVCMDAIRRGMDPHEAVARFVFGIPVGPITQQQRQEGKRRNFMRLYSTPSVIRGLKFCGK